MTDFHRTFVDDRSFIRGAARILVAPITQPRPVRIPDVIALAADAAATPPVALYDAQPGWTDLGATKTGIQITINNAEETFDVDQILGDIRSSPTSWECSVGTQLAEMTPERLALAWEGSAVQLITPAADPELTVAEQEVGFGQPDAYTQRRMAVLFQRPDQTIRGHFFHIVQRQPQESSVTYAKTGEQISVPVRFRVLADPTITDVKKRFFVIRDQKVPTP